jgi:hypothetical protein
MKFEDKGAFTKLMCHFITSAYSIRIFLNYIGNTTCKPWELYNALTRNFISFTPPLGNQSIDILLDRLVPCTYNFTNHCFVTENFQSSFYLLYSVYGNNAGNPPAKLYKCKRTILY